MKAFNEKLRGVLYQKSYLREKLEEELGVVIPQEAELGELIKKEDETIKISKNE